MRRVRNPYSQEESNMKLCHILYVIIILFLSVTLVALTAKEANAGGYYHHYIVEETVIEKHIESNNSGVAAAIATSQHSFDFSTTNWQGSIGLGSSPDDTAVSFGLAKRFKHSLISGSITNESGDYYLGAGMRFNF